MIYKGVSSLKKSYYNTWRVENSSFRVNNQKGKNTFEWTTRTLADRMRTFYELLYTVCIFCDYSIGAVHRKHNRFSMVPTSCPRNKIFHLVVVLLGE